MALSLINNNSAPDGALGGFFSGVNAADQMENNQMSLIRDYLANQREQQMQPLDVAVRSKEAAQARALSTPDMLARFAAGQGGEWDSKMVKGKEDMVLSPFKIATEKQKYKTEEKDSGLKAYMMDLNSALSTGRDLQGNVLTQEQMEDYLRRRESLMQYLVDNPQHRNKVDEILKTGEWHKDVANINGEWSNKNALLHASTQKEVADMKSSTEKLNEQYAKHLDTLANPNSTPEAKALSQRWVDEYRATKLMGNPGAFNSQIDISAASGGKVPLQQSPVQQLLKHSGTPALPAGWTMKK